MRISESAARILAAIFLLTTALLATLLGATWSYVYKANPLPPPPEFPVRKQPGALLQPVSPLLVQYQLDLPGRGEIFPALSAGSASDYWPLAVFSILNTADRPVMQTISAEVPGWSRRWEQTVIIGARETRNLRLNPELLPAVYRNDEIQRATLEVRVINPGAGLAYAQARPVYLHGASDLYWGKQFANAQYIARWVTPHDLAVLRLVAKATRWSPHGRLPGYNTRQKSTDAVAPQVRQQANAVFQALKASRLSYVSSIFTFGNLTGEAQRIRLPKETLGLSTANCIDVSVVFASAMENLGMAPVLIIVPGHAFAGVRLAPQSPDILYVDLTVLPNGSFDQAIARANAWLKKTSAAEVLTVDVLAARVLGIYPLPEDEVQAGVAASR